MAFFKSRNPDKSIDVWDGGTCSTGDQVPPPYYHIGSLLGSNQVLPKLCGQHLHHTVHGEDVEACASTIGWNGIGRCSEKEGRAGLLAEAVYCSYSRRHLCRRYTSSFVTTAQYSTIMASGRQLKAQRHYRLVAWLSKCMPRL